MLERQILASGKTTTGFGNTAMTRDFRHVTVVLSVSGLGVSDTMKVKFARSFSDDSPDFSTTASVSNQWGYTQVFDLNDGKPVDGDVGFLIQSNGVYFFEINQNVSNWVSVEVETIDDGAITIEAHLSDNT